MESIIDNLFILIHLGINNIAVSTHAIRIGLAITLA